MQPMIEEVDFNDFQRFYLQILCITLGKATKDIERCWYFNQIQGFHFFTNQNIIFLQLNW